MIRDKPCNFKSRTAVAITRRFTNEAESVVFGSGFSLSGNFLPGTSCDHIVCASKNAASVCGESPLEECERALRLTTIRLVSRFEL